MKVSTILTYVLFAVILLVLSEDIGGTYLFAFIVMGLFMTTCLVADYCERHKFNGRLSFLNKRFTNILEK